MFVFCLQWAFGGAMVTDKNDDSRKAFHEAFIGTFGQRFPKEGQCFDYYYDWDTNNYADWSNKVPAYVPIAPGLENPNLSFTDLFAPPNDSVRLTYLLNLLASKGKSAMLAGSGDR